MTPLTPAEHAVPSPATAALPAASEALRALVKPILEAPGRTESYEAAEPLIRALPLIADCIAAAERADHEASVAHDAIWRKEVESNLWLHDNDEPLSAQAALWRLHEALRPALVALRDSLGAEGAPRLERTK